MGGLDQATICALFTDTFGHRYHVRLIGGGMEPSYTPPADATPGLIVCREDFAASALHEVAHWCCAAPAALQRVDYGCRYRPPPRGAAGQASFFEQELRVQAHECWFAAAAGIPFNASADDPDWSVASVRAFESRVRALAGALAWSPAAAGQRARQFQSALLRARPQTA